MIFSWWNIVYRIYGILIRISKSQMYLAVLNVILIPEIKITNIVWFPTVLLFGICLMECQYFIFQLAIWISWSISISLTSESGRIFDMTFLIITLVIHDHVPCFVYDYNPCIMDVPIPQLHLFVTLHLIHKIYII